MKDINDVSNLIIYINLFPFKRHVYLGFKLVVDVILN